MKMPLSEITVRSLTFGFDGSPCVLHVVAGFGGMSLEWPDTIYDDKSEKTFKFECNEIMEPWMAGKYSGHAKYVEVGND